MPSPLAHSAMGYAIYRAQAENKEMGRTLFAPRLLLVTLFLSLLPDLDSVAGIILGDFGRYHNNISHSLFVGVMVALLIAGIVWWRRRAGVVFWFLLVLVCYEAHVLMDYVTQGRGVMLLWPFSSARYSTPFTLFYGLRWSEGILSVNHVWTLINELAFVVVVLLLTHIFPRIPFLTANTIAESE